MPLPPDCPQHWNKLYAVLAADTGMLAFQGTKACLLQSQPPTTHRHGPGPATKAPLPGCQLGALITGDGREKECFCPWMRTPKDGCLCIK